MNKVFLMGRLTAEPDCKYPTVAKFNLAVDSRGTERQTYFFKITAFSKTAQFVEDYLHKGTKIVMEGRLQTSSYTNKNGDKVFSTDIIAESIEFAESKKATEETTAEEFHDALDDDGLPFN